MVDPAARLIFYLSGISSGKGGSFDRTTLGLFLSPTTKGRFVEGVSSEDLEVPPHGEYAQHWPSSHSLLVGIMALRCPSAFLSPRPAETTPYLS